MWYRFRRRNANRSAELIWAFSLVYLICTARLSTARNKTGPYSYKECQNQEPYIPYQHYRNVTAKDLPQYDVIPRCDDTASLGDHFLVSANHNSNISWMADTISIPYIVYHAGNELKRHHHPNYAQEAMAYLFFIAEYYDCLAKVTLFAHSHRNSSWHSIHTLDYNIRRVRWDAVPGYAILRRTGWWWEQHVGDTRLNLLGHESHSPHELPREDDDCTNVINGTVYEWQAVHEFYRAEWVNTAWDTFFEPAGFGGPPEKTRCPMTAEFYATRERIRARPRSFYLQAIHWALHAEKHGLGRYETGCVFELLWHVIMGEPAFMENLTTEECQLYDCSF